MIVECIKRFKDLEGNKMREVGDRFEVSSGRFAAINGTHYGKLVKEVPSEATGASLTADSGNSEQAPKEMPKKPARRTRTRKKAE